VPTELLIYDEIVPPGYGFGVNAAGFLAALKAAAPGDLLVRINSPGGSVTEGLAIYEQLQAARREGRKVTCQVDGLAASMASVIACAADTVQMGESALFMIHNPWSGVRGDADEMRRVAETLDVMRDSAVKAYAQKTGLSAETIRALMTAETWLSADKARELKFCDLVLTAPGRESAKACWDLQKFGWQHTPPEVYARWGKTTTPPARPAPTRTPTMSTPESVKVCRDAMAGAEALLSASQQMAESSDARVKDLGTKFVEKITGLVPDLQSYLEEVDPGDGEKGELAQLRDLRALCEELTGAKGASVGTLRGKLRGIDSRAKTAGQKLGVALGAEKARLVEANLGRKIPAVDKDRFLAMSLDEVKGFLETAEDLLPEGATKDVREKSQEGATDRPKGAADKAVDADAEWILAKARGRQPSATSAATTPEDKDAEAILAAARGRAQA